ncbi:hypothetical protein BCAH820_1272 [Bacillus cereus AH820]|uniref:Uncharacterized protein n=2 Tax=Bacillus cereus group TaxID=86661 RepID=Q81TR4_BACAN|nr:hypothetical protein GBAA_1202 [Bacillus anthracis str. 'Ames Ancestor']ACK88271.1 hypothetical protein BCAH820_1272 [Bacillus cereus AH820]EDR16954.1 hypothetical protein BAC_1216 [Bacillus anthracis str. A0488]EDR86231.1 hypothetical protein BAQ_1246 [Bacillus anthracis str. A0193]EDR91235.1 hypothetical protein BAH_1251 [Bacillus anthracis str. A0442]EDS95116.1 hypothetical protein BAK_1279 [Bacillus anthracis str. A0389]EDT20117.1 hypothetical protein BAM_1233 [Bacillus anthracis str. 
MICHMSGESLHNNSKQEGRVVFWILKELMIIR